jgi:serine/threonine protein phosphatase 1
MIYLTSDIHGEYRKFLNMLDKINFNEDDTMIILGDVIDRGNESIPLLQFIMRQKNMELLSGNHEDMAVKGLVHNNVGYYNCWMNNGGLSTLYQFDKINKIQQNNILEYLQSCKLYKIIGGYILSHAGIDTLGYTNNLSIEEFMNIQTEEDLLWRQDFNKTSYLDKYIVIFGHIPTCYLHKSNPMKIWHGKNKIGIDCGACFNGGRLACLRLDDMKEFYA